MLKEKVLSASIFCLSISIIISASIIANGMRTNGDYVGTGLTNMSQGLYNIGSSIYSCNNNGNSINNGNSGTVSKSNTYDLYSASIYLGISENNLISIVNNKDSGIPYIKIDNNYIFSKDALDKWLETARVQIK